jgi:hypothetical protein
MGLRCSKVLVRGKLVRDSLRRLLQCFGTELVTGRGVSGGGQESSRDDTILVVGGFDTLKAWSIPGRAKGLG